MESDCVSKDGQCNRRNKFLNKINLTLNVLTFAEKNYLKFGGIKN